MKIPFVKEWGSWAVFSCSSLAALCAGLQSELHRQRDGSLALAALTFAGMAMLINAKNPLTAALRAREGKTGHVRWFLIFSSTGLALLTPLIVQGMTPFLPFLIIVATYVLLLRAGREHNLVTEYNGFALLTISAPVLYYSLTGELSLRLYAAVLLFFGAGVFKVRVRIRRTMQYRWIMAAYCAAAAALYSMLGLTVLILLPMIENVYTVVFMRDEKLRTTGYIELTKGVLFVLLVAFFWNQG